MGSVFTSVKNIIKTLRRKCPAVGCLEVCGDFLKLICWVRLQPWMKILLCWSWTGHETPSRITSDGSHETGTNKEPCCLTCSSYEPSQLHKVNSFLQSWASWRLQTELFSPQRVAQSSESRPVFTELPGHQRAAWSSQSCLVIREPPGPKNCLVLTKHSVLR